MVAKPRSGGSDNNPNNDIIKKMIMDELLKKMKVKAKPMKGGAACVDYIATQKKKKLEPDQRKMLIKMLNDFIRETKKSQKGGGIIQDLFTGRAAKKFWGDFGRGFKKGFLKTAAVAAPILDVLSIVQPELIPVSLGVHALNKGIGN